MVVYALIAMLCFSVRCIVGKIVCTELGTPLYIEINFLVEFALGLGMLALFAFGMINLTFESNRTMMLALASFF